ncbi:hypothetical protein HDZ31DRAFT_64227 [Schizophyllum fasciatum]
MSSLTTILPQIIPLPDSTPTAAYESSQEERVKIRMGERDRLEKVMFWMETIGLPRSDMSEPRTILSKARARRDTFLQLIEAIEALEHTLLASSALDPCWVHFTIAQKLILAEALLGNNLVAQEFVDDIETLRGYLQLAILLDQEIGQDGLGDTAHACTSMHAADLVVILRLQCERVAGELGMRRAEIYEEGGYAINIDASGSGYADVTMVVPGPASYLRRIRLEGSTPDVDEEEKVKQLVCAMQAWLEASQSAYEPVLAAYCKSVGRPVSRWDSPYSSDTESESAWDVSDDDSGFDADSE